MAGIVRGSKCPVLVTATITVFLIFLFRIGPAFGLSDPPYVAVVRSPMATATNPTIIEVLTGDSQTASVTFDKAVLLSRSAGYMFTLNSPRVPDEAMTNISSEPATLTLPTTMETAARIGIYTITVTEDESPAVAWRVLVTNENATTKALEYSTGASMGDNVTVMVESSVDTARLLWRRDGVLHPDGPTGSSCVRKTSCGDASASKSVVFESFESGAYPEQVHAIMNVIVRECPENMWSPPDCTYTCEPCINGGVCSDLTGLCLCPPGFSGNNCENIHGRNVFGQNAEYKCDDSGDEHADGCQGAIICYPDPLGCFCPAGYKGLNCTEECEAGKFGANCKQECHCANNSLCALDTGVCEDNQCEDGWRGTNCQYGPCPVGYYGDFCNLNCSCSGGEDACSEVEANCANGCAVPWTGTACNQDNGAGNIILTYVTVNSGQAANVTCTVIRNPLVAQSDLVLSPIGTLLTAEEDARSYKQTKVVEITLETAMQVTCSVRDTELMETISLMPNGQPDPPYVALVRSPVATATNPTIIKVHTGDSQTASVTFDKAVLQGQRYNFTENIPRVPDEAMTNISSEPATLTLPTTMETASRTGIYTITVTEDESPAVAWRVLVTNENATIKALEYSTGASMGDNVTVMVESSVATARLLWRRDGVFDPDGSTGSSCTGKTSCGDASASNSSVFESFKAGAYSTQIHAIMNVIVRECPENMWSPPDCTYTCEPCINGGVCSDLTGLCLCPPGFSGNNCENIHGRNVFGQNAEYKCDDSGDDHADGCQGAIICYPDPLGCFCPAGYKGLNCTEECETGTFGANCKQECHCADNTLCALDTGVCGNNQCEDGWRGTNCQYEFNPQYVAVVRSPVATTTNPTTIEVYTGGSQTASVTFDKAVLQGQRYNFTENIPRVPDEAMTNISSEPATLTLPTNMTNAARTGIYTITVTEDESPAVSWRVLVTNEAATIKALEYSTGASMGDNVTVMVESSVATAGLLWRRDGVFDPDGSTGSSCARKTSCGDASASNSSVFESFKAGAYSTQIHAIMNVIVRECPENMWSPPDCTYTCEPCINGGVCSDLTGLCLCPPGFSGNNCENIHGRNVFGQNAEYKCDDSDDDHADGCQGAIICYPDPLGCFCPAGYKGLNCTEECETGTFGANCKQECHCADNTLCALDTGVCENNQCEDGWRGTNCQYEFNPQYVAVVRSPVATTTNPTTIEVYTGGSQTASVTFDKAVLQGQRYNFTENIPRVPDEAMTNISSEPATLTLPTNMTNAARTGIYTITVTEDESPAVAWRVLVTNEAATIKALEYSTGASMGDNVTVMVESSVATARLLWRRDGVLHPDGSTGSSCTGKTSCGDASASNSSVFESFKAGAYLKQIHAIMNVIVRECPENMWSPPDCTNTCEPCINGGVCSDLTGLCLCPPGFSGNNCENIHGRNVFGQNAEYKCDDSGDDHADGCQGAIICYPNPLGCFCPAGYKGLNCTEECETGKFGANCKQECHCADNALCALDTGVCGNNQCEDGWRGTNCQYGPCPVGYYGDFCNLPCSCPGEDACSEVEANCVNGCAVPWTGIACDQDNGAGNIILTYVRVNSGQAANVTCTVIRNPLVAESDLVLSPIGTFLTADEDARSYKQTKVVEITLETAMQVNCSIRNTELMETISLMPYDTSASPVTDGTTRASGSGATPAGPVSRFKNRSGQLLTAIIVPLGVTILVFLVLCGCWIRCLCRQKIRSSSPVELISSRFVTNPGYNPNETDSNSSEGEPEEYADIDDKLIRISDLVIYVKQKKQNRKDNFFTEFKTLPTDQLYPCTVAGKPENKSKNRYLNILPYDNSRVMLKQVIDGPHSDYINASYIDGYKAPKKFIATQGPNEASLVDFWQMVWQENVATIVMLTSLIDGKKKVCLKYWPDQESIYGDLLVKCEKLEEHFQYDYRMFTIALKHGGESRTVKHFHFTDWGDMKIPEFLDPILAFLEIVRNNTSQKKVPNTIVHCSAGVGRTGTYITLDAMLDMAQAKGKVNVYKFVTEMRQRRRQSVQVKEQYQFIFDTLVKNFCIGRTTMTVKAFGMALASLKRTNDETGETYLTEQFKKLEEISVTTSSSDMYAAKNMENKTQNQCSTFLPVEAHTPVLKTPVGERNSRYINASLMDGYKKLDFFVATQMPLKNTILDFWNLVWDHECNVIIMLNELHDKSDQYWPESTSVTFSPFTIKSLSIEHRGTICVRKIEITNSALQKLRTVMQIQCLGWPNNETVSNSSELLLNCVHQLSQWRKERAVNRVLAHCMDGVGRTGVFCGLVAALDQAQAVKEVDIFQLISNMRSAQPLMIQNQEQYQTIFDAVLMHLETGSGTD
ncbi:uncharacterized protein [Apostichopus japonicus]|uniref:uncharacterized protein isoform X2 n=1 Tax=Stichopus japonicus TaxID=307972 RepID=UPI003AB87713